MSRSKEMSPADINNALGQVQGLNLKLPDGMVKSQGGHSSSIDPKSLQIESVNRSVAAITGFDLTEEEGEEDNTPGADIAIPAKADPEVLEDEEEEGPGMWAEEDDSEPMADPAPAPTAAPGSNPYDQLMDAWHNLRKVYMSMSPNVTDKAAKKIYDSGREMMNDLENEVMMPLGESLGKTESKKKRFQESDKWVSYNGWKIQVEVDYPGPVFNALAMKDGHHDLKTVAKNKHSANDALESAKKWVDEQH